MLIAIYFILKGIFFSNAAGGSIFSTVGVILIMGFGISLMMNALTHNSHATDTYINAMKSVAGRILKALGKGFVNPFRFIFSIAPKWVYQKVYKFFKGKVGDGPRTILSIIAAVLTVIILI